MQDVRMQGMHEAQAQFHNAVGAWIRIWQQSVVSVADVNEPVRGDNDAVDACSLLLLLLLLLVVVLVVVVDVVVAVVAAAIS